MVSRRRSKRAGGADPEPARPTTAAPPPPAAQAAPGPPEGPGEEERSLVGLFMMLASSAVVALGEVPDPVPGPRGPPRPRLHRAPADAIGEGPREDPQRHRVQAELQQRHRQPLPSHGEALDVEVEMAPPAARGGRAGAAGGR